MGHEYPDHHTGNVGWVPVPNKHPAGDDARPSLIGDVIGDDGTWPMAGGKSGPCRTWPVMPGCGCLPPDATTWDEEQRQAVEAATDILWRLTGGMYGLCRTTVRPCRKPLHSTYGPLTAGPSSGPRPALIDGQWFNLFCGCPTNGCSCGPMSELRLPGPVYWEPPHAWWPADHDDRPTPPRYAMEVLIDGVELDSHAYTLLESNRLVRTDGGMWPDCQYIDRPPYIRDDDPPEWTAEGTFAVTYWYGNPVPSAGRRAVALLACELWKACQGDESCKLPARVQNITREGVSYTMVDPQDFLTEGRTGITDVDMWLAAVNPHSLRSPSTVFSVDMPTVREQYTTGRFLEGFPGSKGGGR